MTQLQVFENKIFKVTAKQVDEQILFDAEQVARCLGITDQKNNIEYVRWSRVNSYLPKLSPRVAKGDLIPEPLVYKLAFKAQNEVAEQFQDWLAIEVIPAIRKTELYVKPNNRKLLLETALEHEMKIEAIEKDVDYLKNNMRIDGAQEHVINTKGKNKVIKSLQGYRSPAYQKMANKVFARFWRDFKQHFLIPRYSELPKRRFDEALEFIEAWQPDTSTRLEIQSINRQQVMKEVI